MEPYRSSSEPVPCKQSGSVPVVRTIVYLIQNGSERIGSRVNVTLQTSVHRRTDLGIASSPPLRKIGEDRKKGRKKKEKGGRKERRRGGLVFIAPLRTKIKESDV